ncbi:MAG: hypothetical protein WD249_00180 [Gaiellaceae bacterium]
MSDEPSLISEPVVAIAMQNVTHLIAHAHPDDVHLAANLDRATVREALKRLHAAGHRLESDELSAWALAHHWRPEAAEQLRDYAERISAGKRVPRPRGTGQRLRDDIVDQWRQAAQGGSRR